MDGATEDDEDEASSMETTVSKVPPVVCSISECMVNYLWFTPLIRPVIPCDHLLRMLTSLNFIGYLFLSSLCVASLQRLDQLPEMCTMVQSGDPAQMEKATQMFRKLLSKGIH
jgi:hypothetical protein